MSNSHSNETESKTTDTEQHNSEPWNHVFAAHNRFLNDLDCIYEMFRLVSPILRQNDEERQARIKELGKEIEIDGERVVREISSIDEVCEFLGHIQRMKKADRMFRQNVIVSIVSKFDEYLMVLLRCAFEENTSWLNNPNKTVSYKQLFEIESLDN